MRGSKPKQLVFPPSGYPLVPLMACGPRGGKERAGKEADAKLVPVGGGLKEHCSVRLGAENGHRVALQGVVPVVADAFSRGIHCARYLVGGGGCERPSRSNAAL